MNNLKLISLGLATCLLLPIIGFSQSLNIEGSLKDFPLGTEAKVYLQKYFLEEVVLVDSAKVKSNGTFNFLLQDFDEGFYVMNLTAGQIFPIMLSHADSSIAIISTYKAFKEEGMGRILNSVEDEATSQILPFFLRIKELEDSIAKVVQKISYVDSSYYAKKVRNRNFLSQVKQAFNTHLENIRKRYPQTYTGRHLVDVYKHPTRLDSARYLNDLDGDRAFGHWYFFDNTDFNSPSLQFHPAFRYELEYYLKKYSGEFTKDFKETVDIILSKVDESSAMFQYLTEKLIYHFVLAGEDETVSYIEDKYFNGCADEMISNIRKTAEFKRGLSVLSEFPEVKLPNEKGKIIDLQQVCRNNRITLVMFWKSTCPHCLDEMENIKSIKNAFGKRGLEVVAISLDTDKQEWTDAIDSQDMDWINLSDLKGYESEVVQECLVYATPTIFLLNSEGIILRKGLRGSTLKSVIQKLL